MRFRWSLVLLVVVVLLLGRGAQAEPQFSINRNPAPLPAFAFADGEGRSESLQNFRGRYVLLNVWASWCAPCITELASLNRLAADRSGAGFAVLPLSFDRNGADVVKATYSYHDADSLGIHIGRPDNLIALSVRAFPTSIFIGPDGRELWRVEGPMDWSSEAARAMLDYFLHKNV